MKKALHLTLLFALFITVANAQTDKYWSANAESRSNIPTTKAVSRLSFPKEFKLYNLNTGALRQDLFSIVGRNASSHSTVISLPTPEGKMEQFEVYEASNFEPALQDRFPEIRAYSGRGITDKYATLKLSISPQGIQTMIFRVDGKPCEFIEAYSQDRNTYAVYKSQRIIGQLPWTCSTDDKNAATDMSNQIGNTHRSSAGQLKVMRLAQSVTAEYSIYFGATSAAQVANVLAGVNATMTRCNGVYEIDLGVHLNLISNTTDVFYYNPATDPYSPAGTGAGGAWNGELQSTLTSVIGEANYDIGHLFGASGGGGNAGCIGCVCVNNQKGSGFTSPADNIPEGDNFDIDYVVHEVGHQLGANHTFSMSLEGTGVNKEVGSGITIMGYAGITNQDVAPHSIAIFHEASIQQIQTNLATKTCPVTTNISADNATPVVNAVNNYTIPISTPFALTGSATDANAGDALTYCWEQNDNSSTQGNASVASPTKTTGPNWLSFMPSSSPTRYCPILPTILAGLYVTNPLPGGDAIAKIEALSSVSRTLNFRLTVRDNCPYSSTAPLKVGQTSFTDMTVTVTNTSGPFQVTQPNTALTWQAGTQQTITWDVANTTNAPVSCANVKISLSIDGGFTWPIVLAASTANDGSEIVTIPNNVTTTARVVIESVGNIFFDISNSNFTITAPATGFTFNNVAPALIPCGSGSTSTLTLATTASGGFTTPINLTASGNPAGTTVSFSTNPLNPGSSTDITLSNVNTLAPGTYNIDISGTAGAITQNTTVAFTVQPGTPPSITTQPAAVSVCAGTTASFTAASSTPGVSYQWQVSTGGPFTNIAGATSATYSFSPVQADNGNQYQCVVSYLCGSSTTSAAALTVNTAANITQQPASFTACEGTDHTFSVTATGTNVTYQWQVSTNGGGTFSNIPGATSSSYDVNGVTTAMSGNQYQVSITASGSCPAPGLSNAVTLTVNALPVVDAIAGELNVCTGSQVQLTASGADSYSWTPAGTLSNANIANPIATPVVDPNNPGQPLSTTYTVTGTTLGCSSTADVTVTANPLPAVTLTATPANTTLFAGQTVLLKASVTPPGNYVYTWRKDNVAIANTTDSLRVGANDFGSYTVSAGAAVGVCESTSNAIEVRDSATIRLFVFPNPNDGEFYITYHNPGGVTNARNVAVYDNKGARVFKKAMIVSQRYELVKINLKPVPAGIYVVVLYDGAGNRLATEKVVVRPNK